MADGAAILTEVSGPRIRPEVSLLIHLVKHSHLCRAQFKIKELCIFDHALWATRLREDDAFLLNVPTQHDLSDLP